jgi:hypothetical protein
MFGIFGKLSCDELSVIFGFFNKSNKIIFLKILNTIILKKRKNGNDNDDTFNKIQNLFDDNRFHITKLHIDFPNINMQK